MKKLSVAFLVFAFTVCGMVSAGQKPEKNTKATQSVKSMKSRNLLARETDVKKIIVLIQKVNYKVVSENDYVAVIQNLASIARSADISTADGRKQAGLIYMAMIVFQRKAKSPSAYMDNTGKSITDDNWFDGKASSVADELKTSTKSKWEAKIEDKCPSDEKKLREDFQKDKTSAK